MGGFFRSINGADANAAARVAAQEAAKAQSDSGQQLRLLASQQATADQGAAEVGGPGIGQALLKYNRRDGAQSLGG